MSFGICPSIGVGLSGQGGLSPAWLEESVASALGVDPLGHYTGAQQVLSGSDLTSWPGVYGATLMPADAGLRQSRLGAGGRRCAYAAADSTAYLFAVLAGAIKSIFVVASVADQPFAGYDSVISSPANSLIGTDGASTWYTAGGWAHKVNGVASEVTATGGPRIYQATNVGSSTTQLSVFSGIADRSWLGDIYEVIVPPAAPDSAHEAALLAVLARYYRIAL
jgi:hypothetical protein